MRALTLEEMMLVSGGKKDKMKLKGKLKNVGEEEGMEGKGKGAKGGKGKGKKTMSCCACTCCTPDTGEG